MLHPDVTLSLREALQRAVALKTLAQAEPDSTPEHAASAAGLIHAIQRHLDRAKWDQEVDPEAYSSLSDEPIEPIGSVTGDSYHGLAFALADKIFQDIAYVVSCAARDDARRGLVMRLYDDDGGVNTELLERHWRYVREYLQSGRCPDFASKVESIVAMLEEEATRESSAKTERTPAEPVQEDAEPVQEDTVQVEAVQAETVQERAAPTATQAAPRPAPPQPAAQQAAKPRAPKRAPAARRPASTPDNRRDWLD